MQLQTNKERRFIGRDSVNAGRVPGTGSIGTLPMTEEEKEEAAKKAETRVVGFGSA